MTFSDNNLVWGDNNHFTITPDSESVQKILAGFPLKRTQEIASNPFLRKNRDKLFQQSNQVWNADCSNLPYQFVFNLTVFVG